MRVTFLLVAFLGSQALAERDSFRTRFLTLRRTRLSGLWTKRPRRPVPRTVNGTGHTGPSEFCATSI